MDRPRAKRPFLLEDPSWPVRRARRRRILVGSGVVLLTAAVLGITAHVLQARWRMERSYVMALRADLHRLLDVQREYFQSRETYGSRADLGPDFVPSQGIRIEVTADSTRLHALAWHLRSDAVCVIDLTGSPPERAEADVSAVECR